MKRYAANKSSSAKSFNRGAARTKRINLQPPPMRGGYRL